jgi:hypothetical protein
MAAMAMDLEGFAVDASVIEANSSPITARRPTSSIGPRSSGKSGPWLSI